MQVTDRIARITWVEGHGLLATDIRGRLHLLDEHLRVIRSSPAQRDNHPVYCFTVAGDHVATKDKYGTITKWRLDTLDPCNVLDAHNLRMAEIFSSEEEPSPVINRGITVWNGKLYVNTGFVEIAVIDFETFNLLSLEPSFSHTFLEWFCTDRPGQQVVSDKGGNLFIGSLDDLDFPTKVKIDRELNLHRVLYDRRFDRYWVTQDAGDEDSAYVANGIVTVLPDGTIEDSVLFAQDDLEALDFSPDQTRAYAGGFDGELQIFDNTERKLRVAQTVTPFTHQITDLTVAGDGTVYVLSQDGELARLDADGNPLGRAGYRRQCVWDIQHSQVEDDTVVIAADDGVVTMRLEQPVVSHHPNLVPVSHHRPGLGFIRRVCPMPDGSTIGISRDQTLFRLDRDGTLRWRQPFESLLHTIAVDSSGERVLVAASEGAYECDTATGDRLRKFAEAGTPTWACAYLPTGEPCFASRNGVLFTFGSEGELAWRLEIGGYPKRMWTRDGRLYVSGGGGLKEVDLAARTVTRCWYEMLENTLENGAIVGDRVYAVTYGMQLGVFDYDSCEGLGLVEPLPDFVKGVTTWRSASGEDYLLIGGRGGFCELHYLADGGEPRKVRTVYLEREDLGS